jgi:capsular exopolysaccharide synthesis family protein
MSEIFSWLKRAEVERRKGFVDITDEPVDIDFEEESAASKVEESAPLSLSTQPPIEAFAAGRFDLSKANHRLRSVLDPHTLEGEQYRLLRSKLSMMQKDQGIKVLLVTSSVPGEGKTFTSCSLACILALEPGKRVLLIDCDLRRPRVCGEFGMNPATAPDGLSQVLRGELRIDEALLKASDSNLYLLPTGPEAQNPAELLSSPHLERSIDSISVSFDWVILDAPPVLAMADASIIAPLCDGILLVIHMENTPTKVITQSIQRIGQDRILGLILNRVRQIKGSHYYYNYYHRDARGRLKS